MISSLSARFDSSSTVFSPNSLPQSPSLNFTADDKAILKSVSTRSLLAKFGGGGGGGGKFGVGAQSRQSNPSSSSIKTSSSSSQFKLKYTIKPLTHHHHHHHGTPSPVFSLLTDQPGSYSPLSSFGIDATPILSVRLLREIFERLARDNGWNHISTSKSTSSSRSSGGSTSGGDQMKWMNLIRQKIENGSVEMTVKREDGSVDVDGIMNQLRLDPEFGGGGADISKQEQVQVQILTKKYSYSLFPLFLTRSPSTIHF